MHVDKITVSDEVLDFVLLNLYYYLENHGKGQHFEKSQEAECELWNYDEDIKVHPPTLTKVTMTAGNPPRSFEFIEINEKGETYMHFEFDAGKVIPKKMPAPNADPRQFLFEHALEIMAFSRPRELGKGKTKYPRPS